MVEFEKEDRIGLIKRLIEEQKKEEERIKAEEEELLKKAEEIKKKKEDVDKKKDDVNSALEKALDEESKNLRRSEGFVRTDINLQSIRREEVASSLNESKEKDEGNENVEEVKKDSNPVLYRRMPQSPTVSDVYRQLETIYKQIPNNNSQNSARRAQREIYHELKAMANHWGTQKPVVESSSQSPKGYGKEIEVNPHNEASAWDRLTDKVRTMAENAGPDVHHYRQRTEIVLNELRRNFEERQYNIDNKENEFR